MSYALDAGLLESLDHPGLKAISWALQQHKRDLERLNKLADYYKGNHDVLKRKIGEKDDVTKMVVNNAKYIADVNIGFAFGNPVSYAAETDVQGLDEIQEMFRDTDIISHDIELGKDLSVMGRGYELHYLRPVGETTEPRIKHLDPRQTFVVVDNTVDELPLFGVYYFERSDLDGESLGYRVNVYTRNRVLTYDSPDLTLGSGTAKIFDMPHYYGDVPLVEFKNNEDMFGDFEPVIGTIDEYNNIQSNRVQDKENFVHAMLVAYGFDLTQEEWDEETGEYKQIEQHPDYIRAPAKINGTELQYLVNSLDESQVDILAKSIEEAMHKVSFTPNLNDENFSGNTSGEAMKYKLFGLLQLLATKQRYFIRGARQRLILTANMLNVKSVGKPITNVEHTRITMKPNLPVNLSEVIKNIADSQDFIPLAVSLGWLPDGYDPEEIMEQLAEQRAKEQPQSVVSDVNADVAPEEVGDADGEETA